MKKIETYLLVIILMFGLIFRIIGIQENLSFWNDESQVALMSRGILEYGKPVTAIGVGGGIYQLALYYVTALSFKVSEVSEWAGRFPSVVAGLMLIILGFFVGKKLFNTKVAIVVSLLLSFSQIQLAWSTQLRPYIWLELFTLLNIYYLYRYLKNGHEAIDRSLVMAILVSGVSLLFHGTGLLNVLVIFLVFLYKLLSTRQYKYFLLLPIFLFASYFVIFNSFAGKWDDISRLLFQFYFSPLHYRIFLTHNYFWLLIGSFIGFVALLRRNTILALLLGGSILLIFLIAIFKISPNYVRYSLPAFPLMSILFAQGVVSVTDRITKKESLRWLLIVLTFALLSLTGKFIFWPKYYYSINADMRENPIVDYKLAFAKIKDLTKDKADVLVVDAWNDRVPWYLPGQEFVMVNFASPTGIDATYGEKLVGNLDGIKAEIEQHTSGVVIVEDWQSLMSEDIKEYVRKNLKFEFTIQDLPYNEGDHWGISVYSWGI